MPFIFLLFFFSLSWSALSPVDCTVKNPCPSDYDNLSTNADFIASANASPCVRPCITSGYTTFYCLWDLQANNWVFSAVEINFCIPSQPSSSSASSLSPSELSSSSDDSSHGNDFDFNEVKRGFNDFNDIFVLIFACFLLVKLIWMAK